MRRSRRGRLSRSSYFNPRTHVGCDANILSYERFTKISIQAPTWGATFSGRAFSARSLFQSTHPRGVRPRLSADTWVVLTFQSTHPRGVRHFLFIPLLRQRYFNPRTHVGCDTSTPIHNSSCQNFNPRTHVGCDSLAAAEERIASLFQSTHPRGVRRLYVEERGPGTYFNPRTHVGCDQVGWGNWHPTRISIHAPTWGATELARLTSIVTKFQSTHPRGVRLKVSAKVFPVCDFNPRTHVGCDVEDGGYIGQNSYISIHAPTWGATLTIRI